MVGTMLNAGGILLGGTVGLMCKKPLSATNESFFKILLGAFTVYYGLHLTWLSFHGTFSQITRQLLITILALMLGKITGRLLRLQKFSNQIGRTARERISAVKPGERPPLSAGFKTCASLFCAAPLGLVGAIQDGLSDYWYPLGVKSFMDGLATLSFIPVFGWGAVLSALPVLAFQGTLTLACTLWVRPFLSAHGWIDPVNAVGGLLVFCVALVILAIKKIELADYLPSLAFAPLLTWLWR